jgi:hypothetical protein
MDEGRICAMMDSDYLIRTGANEKSTLPEQIHTHDPPFYFHAASKCQENGVMGKKKKKKLHFVYCVFFLYVSLCTYFRCLYCVL